MIKLSAPNTTTDYSSYVTKVPSDTDVVFFPTQQPPAAQTFAEQLVEQGKKAVMFGGDGADARSQFNKAAGPTSPNFAPDITGIPADASIISGWKKANPGNDARLVRPADLRRCSGHPQRDQARLRPGSRDARVACRRVPPDQEGARSRTGSSAARFKWSTKTNDPLNGEFYIFKIQSDGSYKLVS